MSKKNILSKGKLQSAFRLFDKVNYAFAYTSQNNDGSISANEIKAVLGIGKKISNQVWEEVVKEVDENGDGEISYEEFERMMKKFLQ